MLWVWISAGVVLLSPWRVCAEESREAARHVGSTRRPVRTRVNSVNETHRLHLTHSLLALEFLFLTEHLCVLVASS